MISPGRLWWLLRRDVKRGWRASFHHHWTLPRIKNRPAASYTHGAPGVGVHVLTGSADWLLAAWMLASWFHTTDRRWIVTIHDDGTLPNEARAVFARLAPESRIISKAEADEVMTDALQRHPGCLAYRKTHPLGRKIFDMPQFAKTGSFLIFDSDVLFFRPAGEILAWADDKQSNGCWFNEDVEEGSLVSDTEAKDKLGVQLWPRVNSGLCLLRRDAIDPAFCEQALVRTSILRGHIWRIEQTLFALCASRYDRGGLLPKTYEVSLKRRAAEDAISRHYVGAVRDRFFGEGLSRLQNVLLQDPAVRATGQA